METFDELYYKDPYLREFDATVTACTAVDGGYEIELSETAFYPLGGGQPGDRGTLAVADPEAVRRMWEDDPAWREAAAQAAAGKDAAGADGDQADGARPAEGSGEAGAAQAADAVPGELAAVVIDTYKRDDDAIVQLADHAIPAGTPVHGSLDWTWRLDNMEAHTGEHVVSGIVHKLYGYENVGFHMGERAIEVDFSGALTEEQALDVEQRANAAVRANVPVETVIPSAERLRDMDYRSKKELEGPVRIVSIPGVDACACCGTHVATTGEVGLIKILRVTTKKKKTRLELLCGRRALLACEDEMAELRAASNFLSVGDDEVVDAVKRLSAEKDALKHELKQAHRAAIDQEVAQMPHEDGVLVRFKPGFEIDEQRYFCEQALAHGVAPICAVVSGTDGTAKDGSPARLNYVIASSDADLRPACKELNQKLGGRGGGKPNMVQGSYAAGADDIEKALREVLG